MKTQTLTEVRTQLAHVVREVETTKEPVMVTDYGRPVVIIIPVPEHLKRDPEAVAEVGVADLSDSP